MMDDIYFFEPLNFVSHILINVCIIISLCSFHFLKKNYAKVQKAREVNFSCFAFY